MGYGAMPPPQLKWQEGRTPKEIASIMASHWKNSVRVGGCGDECPICNPVEEQAEKEEEKEE